MTKPESYPFLRIAKQYGLDYSAVLITADNLKRNGRAEYLHGVQPADALNAMIDIAHAVDTYKQICDGVIDWQTGECFPGCHDMSIETVGVCKDCGASIHDKLR